MKEIAFVAYAAVAACAIFPAFAGSAEPDGTDFVVTADASETYKNHGSVRAFTAQTVNGTPKLRIPDAYTGSAKWTLFKSGAGSYNFGPVIGTMLLLK